MEQLLATWRRHHEILIFLVDHIPAEGWTAVPSGSKGRDVAAQLDHLDRVRRSWLHYHATGKRPKLPRYDKTAAPSRTRLRASLNESGAAVARYLEDVFRGEARLRLFGNDPVRWLGYLIAHESHHRGQIALALKQSGLRLPDKVAVDGLWGQWIWGT